MSALSDKGITLEGLAAAVDALRQELATWKALAHKQDQLTADQITATQSGATAAKISQIAINTAAIQSLAAQVAGQISLEYVSALPATGEPLTLYLVPQGDGTAPNFCNEYLWINNAWELIGTTGAMANNGELTIQVNGVTVGTFTANQATNAAVNIAVPTNTNQLTNGAGFVDTAALQAALLLKQNSLNAAQLEAVNSGITAAAVQQIADNATAISGKQDKLSTAQQAAVDSGATAAKIDQIAANASAIVSLTSSKQEQLSTTQLAAVNSGVTAAAVQQIGTNASNISGLQTAVSSKAADNAVVHLTGAETITGDKTWTGSNTFSAGLLTSLVETNPGNTGLLLRSTDQTWENGSRVFLYSNTHTGQTCGSIYVDVDHGDGNNTKTGLLLLPNAFYPAGGGTIGVSLGTSTDQWSSVYANTYYYNGTQWGLDTSNEWTGHNKFVSPNTNFGFKSSTAEAGSYTASSNWIYWQDKNDFQDAYIARDIWGDGSDSLRIDITSKRSNGAPSTTGTAVDCGFSINIHANGSKSLTPFDNGGTDLGTSSNKWKTLNGINPGNLSIPNISSVVDISGSITSFDGTTIDLSSIITVPGWINIVIPYVAGDYIRFMLGRAGGATAFNNSHYIICGSSDGNYISVFAPVSMGFAAQTKIKASGGAVTQARFYPCLGNV